MLTKEVTKRKPQKKTTSPAKQGTVATKRDSPLMQAIKEKLPADLLVAIIGYEENRMKEERERLYFDAMREMQNEIPELPKTKEATDKNGKSYKYCPLPLMRKIIQPYLYKYGFIYRWDFRQTENNKIECTIILKHSGGHFETASMTTDPDNAEGMGNIQSIGSSRTYLQRYTFIAVMGLTTAEDDNDGASESSKISSAIPGPKPASEERLAYEAMDLNELVLKIDPVIFEKYLAENFGAKRIDFSEAEKTKIKKYIMDTLVKK